jgi:hypothetical protein
MYRRPSLNVGTSINECTSLLRLSVADICHALAVVRKILYHSINVCLYEWAFALKPITTELVKQLEPLNCRKLIVVGARRSEQFVVFAQVATLEEGQRLSLSLCRSCVASFCPFGQPRGPPLLVKRHAAGLVGAPQ